MGHYEDERSRSCRAGQLAEEFCNRKFGIVENGVYEIKSSSWQSYQIVLRVCQLIESLDKQYVIVRYRRDTRAITRGPRKGRPTYTEKIVDAFHKDKKKWVYVVRGIDLMTIVHKERIRLLMTKYHNDGKWAPYWTVPIRCLPTSKLHEDEEVVIYGNPSDPPRWSCPELAAIVEEEEVPF